MLATSDTAVGCFQVRLEILWARLRQSERSVRYGDLTASPTGTASVDCRQDISTAAHVTVVLAHAPAQPHPAVLRMRHQDGLASAAGCVERFRFTERFRPGVIG